jgi:hypothetical protein
MDIVALSTAGENAMTDARTFDPALFADAAIDVETAKLNSNMIQMLTGQPECGSSALRPCGRHAGAVKGRFRLPLCRAAHEP